MFSKILIKLVDQAIVPAVFLIAVRIVSVVMVSKYFAIPVDLGPLGFAFDTTEDFIIVNSYSSLVMVAALTLGLTHIVIKFLYFHDTHISPKLSAKVFTFRLSSLIQGSFDLYSQGSVWMSYLYLITLVNAIMALFGYIFVWVFIVSFTVSIICTFLLTIDVERELIAGGKNV